MSLPELPAEVLSMLEKHGWAIESAVSRHENYPATFDLPSPEALDALQAGWQVKLLIWFVDETEDGTRVDQCERMWAVVEAITPEGIEGLLASAPLSAQAPLELGSRVRFQRDDVCDVLRDDDGAEHIEFLRAFAAGDEAFAEFTRGRDDRVPAVGDVPPVEVDEAGRTQLHYAALEGDLAAAQASLNAGADVGASDRAGYTPLHFAAQSSALAVIELLVARGAPLEAQDAYGNTPLWTATFNDKTGDCVRVLLEAGADPDHVNRAGTTPRTLAETMESPALSWYRSR